ncbi:MAG TPA: hypothetical protein VHV08_06310 [Pirellulales bacterium]|jgi:hypothetical protein|nr:hypothetical protein [Pirellulales bacterium]
MIAVAHVASLLRDFGAVSPAVAPQLAVSDHGDNTGATATISAAALASTNIINVQSFRGDVGTGPWQMAGTVIGNGTTSLALAAGHYFAYAASSVDQNTAVSSVVYFVVSDGLEALHSRCLTAVQARIGSLALPGLPSENIVVHKLPLERRLGPTSTSALPAVIISPRRTAMPPAGGTNNLDDVDYDVLVAILDRDNREPTLAANLDRHLLWRQQIARAFRNQRLSGVAEVINAAVEPAEGLLEEAWKRELMVSALLLRFTSRETRGMS